MVTNSIVGNIVAASFEAHLRSASQITTTDTYDWLWPLLMSSFRFFGRVMAARPLGLGSADSLAAAERNAVYIMVNTQSNPLSQYSESIGTLRISSIDMSLYLASEHEL